MNRYLVAPAFALSLLLSTYPCAVSQAKEAERSKQKEPDVDLSLLSLQRIYASGELSARSYAGTWRQEGHQILQVEATEEGSGGKGIVAIDASSGKREVLVNAADLIPPGKQRPLAIDSYSLSDDGSQVLIFTGSQRVWRQNTRGDYWVLDRSARTLRKLGGDRPAASLMFAKFSPDAKQVAYVHKHNLYVEDLRSGDIRAVTQSGNDSLVYGTADWVNEEEFGIRDGFQWSPDGKAIAFWRFDTSDVQTMTMINNTDRMYPTLIQFPYPKTGQINSAVHVSVVNLESGQTIIVPIPGNSRDHYIVRMNWTPNSATSDKRSELMIQQMNRLQNTNIVRAWEPRKGSVRKVFTESDDAWVDVHDELFWIDKGKRFTWISEADGWRRIYVVDYQTGERRGITPEGVDAIELLQIDESKGVAYVIASPDSATQRYLYKASLADSTWQRISPKKQSGTHSYQLSADSKYAIHTFSDINTPPVINLIELPSHNVVRTLEDNAKLQAAIEKLSIRPAKRIEIPIGDGIRLDAWKIQPAKESTTDKHPLLMYVYGEPAGTTVIDRWGGASYLWHQMLAQQGFVVMSVDNRGTPQPRGRQWRKSVYRNIGIHAPEDQAAAVRQILKDNPDIDPDRVGVWGWSGGGSMSLLAIFKHPDLYKAAISIAPVPNQRYYDTIYQERYMGLPSDNVEGYREGSAITHAQNLQGDLLLIHGTGDDNCHYGTSEMLINELIRHNKPFQMMAYPNRSHSIHEGKHTTLHLRTLMTKFLLEKLTADE